MHMLSVASTMLLLSLIIGIYAKRKAAFVAAFFLIFPFTTRMIDVMYIDLFGPVFASELGRYIGGGSAAPIFAYAACAFLLPLLVLFRDTGGVGPAPALRAWLPYHSSITRIAFVAAAVLVASLYGNMAMTGTVPLLVGMDRLEYNLIAGDFHNSVYGFNFLVNFLLGAMTVLPRLNGRDFDLRFSLLFGLLLLYWVLTGNRFSVFFVQFSFYFMPFAAVILARASGVIGPLGPNSALQRFLASRALKLFGVAIAVACVGGLVVNSYYNVRGYRDPIQQIEERILVQPVELWLATWEQVSFKDKRELISKEAIDGLFVNPIDATKNTTIQYLMTKELGYFRSAELHRIGQQYNGGYPEIHFEIFNPWLALLILPLVGLLTAFILKTTITMLRKNMVLTSIMATYVYFGFSLHYIGGMINFITAPSFAVKVMLLIIAYFWERQFSVGVPVTVVPSPATAAAGPIRGGLQTSGSM